MAEYDPSDPDGQYQYEYQDPAPAPAPYQDPRIDEYGLHKPAESWTETMTELAYPSEIAQDPNREWYQDGRAFLAAPAGLAGHFMDELSPIDTNGDWHVPMPILGEMAHGNEEAEYQRQRAAA